jgi:arylsulfatase
MTRTTSSTRSRAGSLTTLRCAALALAVALLASSTSCTSPAAVEEVKRPTLSGALQGYNLLLISIDTVRADRLGAFGHSSAAQSPAIDRLAERGVRFLATSAPRSLTWPSLASVLTGQYPSGHGLTQNGYSFRDDQITLARRLQQAGYATSAVLSNMCQANHTGWDNLECAGGVDVRVERKALAWIDQRDRSRPFFLWTHYFGAHGPYYNGGDRAARAFPEYAGVVQGKKNVLNRIMTEQIPLDDSDVRQLDALYDAAVQGTDAFVGKLLTELEGRGELDRTVVVLLADHGEDLYDHHGYIYHACSPYESGLHVPLVIVLPPGLATAAAGAAVSQPVELVDVLPTLADLFALPVEECVDGSSLVPYLERPDRGGEGKAALSEYGSERIATIRQGDWKLIVNPDGHQPVCLPGAPPGLYPIGTAELYDLGADPEEQHDLSTREPGRVRDLQRLLAQREAAKCAGPGTTQQLPEDLRKELEALGYVAN